MSQRAQRARWMKTDPNPDYEIPMLVDFINDPPNANNAIRKAYLGSGYYSGYVIDCDGKVLYSTNWAWFATGKDWWGLPLDAVSNLTQLLDNYLKNPPSCYKPAAAPTDGGAPAADSGGPKADSGATPPDTGSVAADSGSATADSSAPGPDASAGPGGSDDACSVSGPPRLGGLAWLALATGLFAWRRRAR